MVIRDYFRNGRVCRVVALSDTLTPFEIDMHLHDNDYRKNIVLVIENESVDEEFESMYTIFFYQKDKLVRTVGGPDMLNGAYYLVETYSIDSDPSNVFKDGFDFSLFPNPTDDEIEWCSQSMCPQTQENFLYWKAYNDRMIELSRQLMDIPI